MTSSHSVDVVTSVLNTMATGLGTLAFVELSDTVSDQYSTPLFCGSYKITSEGKPKQTKKSSYPESLSTWLSESGTTYVSPDDVLLSTSISTSDQIVLYIQILSTDEAESGTYDIEVKEIQMVEYPLQLIDENDMALPKLSVQITECVPMNLRLVEPLVIQNYFERGTAKIEIIVPEWTYDTGCSLDINCPTEEQALDCDD